VISSLTPSTSWAAVVSGSRCWGWCRRSPIPWARSPSSIGRSCGPRPGRR
jgi:hypothetical protein